MNTKQTIHNDNATFDMKLGNDLGFAGRNVEAVTDSGKAPSVERFEVESNVPNVDTISEFETYETYRDAVAEVDEIVDQWEKSTGETADRSWASRDNMYCAKCGQFYAAVVKSEA